MSTAGFTMFDVFEEIDDLVYTFPDDDALEAWSLHGDETFTGVRPAQADDRIDPAELQAMFDQVGLTPSLNPRAPAIEQ